MKRFSFLIPMLLILALLGSACAQATPTAGMDGMSNMDPKPGSNASAGSTASLQPSVSYALETTIDGGMAFVGKGGAIDGQRNPTLHAAVGDVVGITLTNGDGVEHDFTLGDLNVMMRHLTSKGDKDTVIFKVEKAGEFAYYCSLPGHRQAGMEGKLVVGGQDASAGQAPAAVSIVHDPTNLPAPIGDRPPQKVRVDIQTIELEGQLADGTTYMYSTFDGTVPGPFIRVRVGDTVELHLKNSASSSMAHSIDLHAVTGPGGGAAVTQAAPGEEKSFTFKALNPGLFVYHCATPMVAQHIANGMFGLILVEPEGGLPPVAREFYVMQSEIYTAQAFGAQGKAEFNPEKLLDERPEYFVLNGAVGALTKQHPLMAKTGETVRIFFGVGGPNYTSPFHVIGEIFDRVYDQASLTSAPLTDVQTTLVPPGGATVVEFKLEVPGRYILVDHALSRMERGLAGYLIAEGPENPDVFYSDHPPSAASGH